MQYVRVSPRQYVKRLAACLSRSCPPQRAEGNGEATGALSEVLPVVLHDSDAMDVEHVAHTEEEAAYYSMLADIRGHGEPQSVHLAPCVPKVSIFRDSCSRVPLLTADHFTALLTDNTGARACAGSSLRYMAYR